MRAKLFDRGQGDAEDERIEARPGGVIDPGLVAAKSNASLGEILKSEERSKGKSSEDNEAWDKQRRAPRTTDEKQNQGKKEIELVFDCERPGVGESSPAAEADVLDRKEKFPERENLRIFPARRQEKVDRENDKIGRENAQGAAGKEAPEFDLVAARERREELAADQITAEDKEEVDADPTETIEPARRFETEKRGVINRDNDDRQRAKKIETRLALTSREARIDCELATASLRPEGSCRFNRFLLNGWTLAESRAKKTRCRRMVAIGSG